MQRIGNKGGMSFTTGYNISFGFEGNAAQQSFISKYYDSTTNKAIVDMLCDEAQLPNVQSGVSQVNNRYLGEGPVYYPHTRIYTDISLGFLLDADLTALKFFTSWFDSIYGEEIDAAQTYDGSFEGALSAQARSAIRINRLKFSDQYRSTLRIIKTETGSNTSHDRAPITYIMEKCYPYSIDAVPLSYGTSQVARCTVNFYYARHTVSYGNLTVSSRSTSSNAAQEEQREETAAASTAATQQARTPLQRRNNTGFGFTNSSPSWYEGADSASSPSDPLPPSTGTPLP